MQLSTYYRQRETSLNCPLWQSSPQWKMTGVSCWIRDQVCLTAAQGLQSKGRRANAKSQAQRRQRFQDKTRPGPCHLPLFLEKQQGSPGGLQQPYLCVLSEGQEGLGTRLYYYKPYRNIILVVILNTIKKVSSGSRDNFLICFYNLWQKP